MWPAWMIPAGSAMPPSQTLLDRAATFRALAQCCAWPSPGHAVAVRRSLATIPASSFSDRGATTRAPGRTLRSLRRRWVHQDDTALTADYLRLFAPTGPVQLHETAYGDGRRLAGREYELSDLNGFYAAFGLRLPERDPHLPDHLATELEFLSLLLVKEAWAGERGQRAEARATAAATHAFLDQHLGRWVTSLAEAIIGAGAASPWRELADAVTATVSAECRLRRVRPQRFSATLTPDDMQSESFVCPFEAAPAH